MQFIESCGLHNITDHSLLHHSKDASDYCKCYALHLDTQNVKTEEIAERFQSKWSGWMNAENQKGKGFICIKPFLHTQKEVIYGSNIKHMELRISILQDNKRSDLYYFILLINYNSTSGKYLFWPLSVLLKLYFRARIKRLLRHPVPPNRLLRINKILG